MGLGPKIGLLSGLVTAIVVALAVLPGMKSSGGDEARTSFEATGIAAASSYAIGVTPSRAMEGASGKSATSKDLEGMRKNLEEQLKGLKLRGEAFDLLQETLAVTLAMAGDPTGKAAVTPLDALINRVKKGIDAAKDEEDRAPLREQRNRLVEIQQRVLAASGGDAPAAPTAGGVRALLRPNVYAFQIRAVWTVDANLFTPKRAITGKDGDLAFAPPTEPRTTYPNLSGAYGSWRAAVGGVPSTLFYAPLGGSSSPQGYAVLSFDDPPASEGGGSNKVGLLMLFLGPLLVGGLGWVLAGGHAKPIQALARELDRLGSTGDPTRRIAAHGPEANAIARSVERMVANLKFREQHEMKDLAEVVSREQEMAAQIHHGLMPKDPPRIPGWEVETLFKPGFEIGGDHFDYFRIDGSHLGVMMLDTSVRGIPAAVVMSMARAYVRAEAPGVLAPAEVLMKVNRLLAADLSQGQYVTALYAVIDVDNGTARIASAGHLPLVIYRHGIGKTAIVNPEGIALGLDVGPVFDRSINEVEVEIGPGDRLVLHTDGALKVQNETGDEFGEQRLYAVIKQEAPKNSQAFVNFVGSTIDQFHLNTPQNDDITLSTVKRLK